MRWPVFRGSADPVRHAATWAASALIVVWSAVLLTRTNAQGAHTRLLDTVGLIAAWRYGWSLLHFLRAAVFLHLVFPQVAARARQTKQATKISHIYAVVASFNIPEAQFRAVYRSLVANCLALGVPATIVAAVTSDRDCAILAQLIAELGETENIEIIAQFQRGDGKRSALAMALRCIAQKLPPANALTVFLDGDIVLEPDALRKSVPFFQADPALGAITSNNDAVLNTDGLTRHWYGLRHAQRHVLMASMALSGRLLVLTGRFSMYRTADSIDPAFIAAVEDDHIDHWLYGRIPLLSGDDKSIWFHLLKRQRKMLYIPDVKAVGFEGLPQGDSFVVGTSRLMFRWFGNMLRANEKAIRLGPQTCGGFLWWALVDQRLSMWTAMVGPITAILFAIAVSPLFLLYYLAWVAVTRTVVSALEGLLWGRFDPTWPFLMAYTQIWGSFLKIYLQFRLNRQSWTRQGIRQGATISVENLAGAALHALAFGGLICAAAWVSGLLEGQM